MHMSGGNVCSREELLSICIPHRKLELLFCNLIPKLFRYLAPLGLIYFNPKFFIFLTQSVKSREVFRSHLKVNSCQKWQPRSRTFAEGATWEKTQQRGYAITSARMRNAPSPTY
ncbi:hypothetical protein CDAR_551301 [Caerostris darwini]|uniref:Uncharacterized protein n=1 Tax=Caerostris darwini TaxID=1538125 RepID=A0AAV4V649_9ARAC|nr:hypothetical protein CDAR_551301 [Caerostris darwini]